ncbi:MAG: hypothetical protein KC910_04045, partial [Candidatus Eremiobacteraeota bacterium]|nr:hypothetical protein [Candidatus Eremiobacteraeota bacterium]
QTAYLKANYRREYMAALLTSVISSLDKVSFFIKECTNSGIEVLGPDLNESQAEFSVVPAGIRWGLAAIRNVGKGAVDSLLESRAKEGPFQDLAELCCRVDLRQVNKRVLEGLIKAGALDSFGETRATLLENIDLCIEQGQRAQREAETGQFSLFEALAPSNTRFADLEITRKPEIEKRQLLDLEREMLGIYLTDSPLTDVRETLQRNTSHRIADLANAEDGTPVSIGGMINSVRKIMTRFKTPMAFLEVEDFSGSIEVSVRPAAYEKVAPLLESGGLVVVKGRAELRQRRGEEQEEIPSEEVKVQAEDILCLERLAEAGRGGGREKPKPGVHIRVQLFQSESLPQLRNLLLKHRGGQTVYLHLCSPKGETVMHLSQTFGVKHSDAFAQEVQTLLGREALWAEAS